MITLSCETRKPNDRTKDLHGRVQTRSRHVREIIGVVLGSCRGIMLTQAVAHGVEAVSLGLTVAIVDGFEAVLLVVAIGFVSRSVVVGDCVGQSLLNTS